MDCHRCENIRYYGFRCARCAHEGHRDVVISPSQDGRRRYNMQICPDFVMKRRCSNCLHWTRGEYFADGKTPSRKGFCSLGIAKTGEACRRWIAGRTSWKKRRENEKSQEAENR